MDCNRFKMRFFSVNRVVDRDRNSSIDTLPQWSIQDDEAFPHIGAVIEGEALIGILSESDIVSAVAQGSL